MINLKALFSAYNQFRQNPNQFLQQLNIPSEHLNSSQDAIQYLMNTGRVTQEQYNAANNQLKQIQQNPLFKNLFKS